METASVSMNTGHPTHPLFKSMRKGMRRLGGLGAGADNATTNYEGSDLLYVFSTSTTFEPRVGISKFAAYTFLEHHGDFLQATKALVAQGYVEGENHSAVPLF
jgi:hypothetical protein